MEAELLAIQRLYPQVFHACHVRHSRSRSNAHRISERDGALLAHLAPDEPRRPTDLARHVGIGLPTVSAALARLAELGHVERARIAGDGRASGFCLTARGADALRATSVLDDARLAAALARLTRSERRAVVEGLALLARAAGEAAVETR